MTLPLPTSIPHAEMTVNHWAKEKRYPGEPVLPHMDVRTRSSVAADESMCTRRPGGPPPISLGAHDASVCLRPGSAAMQGQRVHLQEGGCPLHSTQRDPLVQLRG